MDWAKLSLKSGFLLSFYILSLTIHPQKYKFLCFLYSYVVGGPPNLRAWCFFLVEERSEAGQVSQPVRACKLRLGLGVKLLFVSVMFMFVGVMNFSHVQKIRFVIVKICWSNSNQFLVILIWSSELAFFYHKPSTQTGILNNPYSGLKSGLNQSC